MPVINGLSDLRHPCQVLSDCFTLIERRGRLDGLRVALIGDGNNIANSWIAAAARFGFDFALACPPGYEPDADTVRPARAAGRRRSTVTHDAGGGRRRRRRGLHRRLDQHGPGEPKRRSASATSRPIRSTPPRCARAKPDAVVMHCLPAHRGEEITGEVIDGPQSIVFDQAENRLHVQKAIMVWLNQRAGTEMLTCWC